MLTPISRITPRVSRPLARWRLRDVVSGALVCLGVAAALATTMQAQQTLTPQPIIVADFNHDGIPDALVLSTTAPTATIAFGAVPYGTFSAVSKVVTFPTACTSLPQGSVLAGDFNNDGLADIAFFCGQGASGVMLGNGDGTFGTATTFYGISSSIEVLGDFNHDGKLDIAAVGVNGTDDTFPSIAFFPGNGDGTFGDPVFSQYNQSTSYVAVAVADVNGDTYPDILALNYNANGTPSVDVFGNNKDGTFGTSTDVVAPNTTVSIAGATAASTILIGNFFGKTATDFVVPIPGSSPSAAVVQNTSTAATYSFADPTTVSLQAFTSALAGTFTGSGFTDLVLGSSTGVTVLANDGTGNFATKYSTLAANVPPPFAVADANGDGYSDLYSATLPQSGPLQLAVAVTTGTASATSLPFSLGIGSQAITASWSGNVNLLASTATGQQIVTGAGSVTTVTSSKNPSLVGDSVTFSANVAPVTAGVTPTGTVTFNDGATALATMPIDDGGNASFTTSTLTQATHAITAVYSGDGNFAASTSPILSQVVATPSVAVTVSAPPTTPPGTQTTVTVTLAQAYPVDLVGTLTIGFTRSTTPNVTDPSLQFADGGTMLSFPIPAGTTAIPPIQLQVGTIAGTITVPLTLTAAGANVTPANLPPVTIQVPPAVPTVSGMTVTRSGNQLTVVMHGFSNTREVVSAQFHFTAAPGATLGTMDLALPADTIFNTDWFDTDPSDAYGSTFTYTQIFNISDDATTVGSVEATLTNSVGASTMTTAQ